MSVTQGPGASYRIATWVSMNTKVWSHGRTILRRTRDTGWYRRETHFVSGYFPKEQSGQKSEKRPAEGEKDLQSMRKRAFFVDRDLRVARPCRNTNISLQSTPRKLENWRVTRVQATGSRTEQKGKGDRRSLERESRKSELKPTVLASKALSNPSSTRWFRK